jgi:hypothetical protein
MTNATRVHQLVEEIMLSTTEEVHLDTLREMVRKEINDDEWFFTPVARKTPSTKGKDQVSWGLTKAKNKGLVRNVRKSVWQKI